jgi:TIR- and PNP-associating SLOG family
MNLRGRRIHIVGSAAPNCDEKKLLYAHALVRALSETLGLCGANFVIPFGREPVLRDRSNGPSIIFDWTVAEAVHQLLQKGRAVPSGPNGRLIATLATNKTDANVPESRRAIYDDLRAREAVRSEFLEPGWTAGAIQRQRLAQLGDILVGLSGGQGLEHLAIEYSTRGKPVIPLDLQLGSSSHDGSGGAARLFDRALTDPTDFFKVHAGAAAADLLDRTRTRYGETEPAVVVSAINALLDALKSPSVFYVRLLSTKSSEYNSVETFFRNTVDVLVAELGYEPLQMGLGENEFAWMNKAIFDSLHHSSVALVDLTGLRPNCFMELGYALGNKQRVILTARDDTTFPFDAFALEAFLWREGEDKTVQLGKLRKHWERNINMPTLVRPTAAR